MTSAAYRPPFDLPLPPGWTSEDAYVHELLTFATSSELFRHLCGGVHVLDFLTSEPDLYTKILPEDWRTWFDEVEMWDVIQYVLHDVTPPSRPPDSLREYVDKVKSLCLVRSWKPDEDAPAMPRHISVGMKPKKIHEVSNFAAFVDNLSKHVSQKVGQSVSLVDFGSGQNYLGRTLACPPYNRDVIAIERKHHNVAGAKGMDVHAKLSKKEKVMRNKKEWKRRLALFEGLPTPPEDGAPIVEVPEHVLEQMMLEAGKAEEAGKGSMTYVEHNISDGDIAHILFSNGLRTDAATNEPTPFALCSSDHPASNGGHSHISNPSTNSLVNQNAILTLPPGHRPLSNKTCNRATTKMDNGSTPNAIASTGEHPTNKLTPSTPVLTISLHSCGNLSHHALRSLPLNLSVSAIAIIGCCYNLLTERLGPATYKLPSLRPNHPRLIETGNAYDPHGFPMSNTLANFLLPEGGHGVRLNITARMMAVQAPYNWGRTDSEDFFIRHFYRALLQKILLDCGVVKQAPTSDRIVDGNSLSGADEQGTPLIIGSLRKSAFSSFEVYCRAAIEKLTTNTDDPALAASIKQRTCYLTDHTILAYEHTYRKAKKDLSIIWTLMAFSAGAVESIIAVDRWLFLKEQDCVQEAWVQPVFDYAQSPRNLCVVGIRKQAKIH